MVIRTPLRLLKSLDIRFSVSKVIPQSDDFSVSLFVGCNFRIVTEYLSNVFLVFSSLSDKKDS